MKKYVRKFVEETETKIIFSKSEKRKLERELSNLNAEFNYGGDSEIWLITRDREEAEDIIKSLSSNITYTIY